MRLTEYKKAVDEAKKLPKNIPTFLSYFRNSYSPRASALQFILNEARKDSKYLFPGEFFELYEYIEKK